MASLWWLSKLRLDRHLRIFEARTEMGVFISTQEQCCFLLPQHFLFFFVQQSLVERFLPFPWLDLAQPSSAGWETRGKGSIARQVTLLWMTVPSCFQVTRNHVQNHVQNHDSCSSLYNNLCMIHLFMNQPVRLWDFRSHSPRSTWVDWAPVTPGPLWFLMISMRLSMVSALIGHIVFIYIYIYISIWEYPDYP